MPARKSKSLIVQQPAAQLYRRFVEGIKERIRTAQLKAALAANAELVLHYWEIGREILANQEREGWGAKVIDRLAADLQREFPKLAGYSSRNLKYMRAFAVAWPDRAIMQQLAAQMPWAHNCVLLDRVKDAKTREFYIRETVGQGWSRSVLVHHLDTDPHKRAGKAPSNFALTLPSAQSDLAKELLKDPYVFKPAPLDESANERALEGALIARLKDFLIELGSGFAFVGNQYRLEVDGEEFFLDLLLSGVLPGIGEDEVTNHSLVTRVSFTRFAFEKRDGFAVESQGYLLFLVQFAHELIERRKLAFGDSAQFPNDLTFVICISNRFFLHRFFCLFANSLRR